MANAHPTGMACSALVSGRNKILAAMRTDDLSLIAENAELCRYSRGELLTPANSAAESVFFVEIGIASVVKPADGDHRTEICLIGPESFSGAPLVLGDGRWPYETIAQASELTAVVVPAATIKSLIEASSSARNLLTTAVHHQMVQIAENLVSAVWQRIEARLARWLLMYRDRLDSDRIEVTHEIMSIMIGARRSKVTEALHNLEASGAIKAKRGVIMVRDAQHLRTLADGSYSSMSADTQKL